MVDINHVAKLARIGLTEGELKKFENELSAILDFVAKLNEAKTEGVQAIAHITGAQNVLRSDETNPLCQDEAVKAKILENAPGKERRFFKVKRVLE